MKITFMRCPLEAKTLPTQNEVNIFLDVVRSSGVTNMFGAGSYIEEHFDVNRRQARDFLMEWMRTFSERSAKGEVVN